MIKDGKLLLEASERIFNEIATDTSVSGPTADGLYHITFSVDRVEVVSQTLTEIENEAGRYKVSYSPDDSRHTRVRVGCCSLPSQGFYGLFASILDRAIMRGETETIRSILDERDLSKGAMESADDESK
jgi:hypothetical protein